MVETATHLTDHVFPRLPVRQWVLSVPHRYFGVLVPNSPLRSAAVALAQPPPRPAEQANMSEGAPGVVPLGHTISPTPEPAPPKR